MTSLISPPKFSAPEARPTAPIGSVNESAEDTKKKMRKPPGRESALLAGVSNALKKRLGE